MQEEKVGSYTVNMDAGVCFNVYTSDVLCQVHVYLCIIYIYCYNVCGLCPNMPLNIQLTFPGPVLCDVH